MVLWSCEPKQVGRVQQGGKRSRRRPCMLHTVYRFLVFGEQSRNLAWNQQDLFLRCLAPSPRRERHVRKLKGNRLEEAPGG